MSQKVLGLHETDDNDNDVDRVHIVNSKTIYLPNTSIFATKFKNLKNFWVSRSQLKFIERSKLRNLENITVLCLNNNNIEEIPGDSFQDLKSLEVLWLHNNKIIELNEDLLSSLEKLAVIDARNNLIKHLPQKLFVKNANLKVVNFEYNFIQNIDVDFTLLKNIKWVVVSHNECIDVAYCKALDCLKSVKQLQDAIEDSC